MKESDVVEVQKRVKRWSYVVQKDFVCNTGLSNLARFLWIVLESFASSQQKGVWPSTLTLRKIVGVGKNKLFDLTRELEAAGYLEKHRRRSNKPGREGMFDSNLYILMDEPFYGVEPPPSGRAVAAQAPAEPPPVKSPYKRYKVLEEGAIPNEGKTKNTKNPGLRPRPRTLAREAAPGGAGSSSSSTLLVDGRGCAPDPAGVGTPDPIGSYFPPELLQDGKPLVCNDDDPVPVQTAYFLNRWRKLQKMVLGRFPVLTSEDQQRTQEWITQARPEALQSFLAMAVVAWGRRIRKESNGFKRFVGCQRSRKLSTFLRNVDLIEQELSWDHYATQAHRDVLADVVSSE